jgi:glycosyltransferase involved in cell wall biosynthesis
MNILLVNRQGNAVASGVASHFENITNTLLALGHQVERLVAEEKGLTNEKRIKTHFFKYIERVPYQDPIKRKERILKNRQFFEKTLKKINHTNIDVVICSNDIRIPELEKYFDRKKIIVIIPSALGFSPICNPSGHKKVAARMKKNLAGVKVVVLSKKMKAMLKSVLGKEYDITVIPPGVDQNKFSGHGSAKRKGVLYVGRIAEEKNIPALINAFSLVKTNEPLILVGGGDCSSKWKEMAKQTSGRHKIIFTGKKNRVEKYYHKAKVFVLPSKFEAFGLVILEAMSAGIPVIAFKPSREYLTASDEIIDDGIDGFLVKNVEEMAEKIELLLKDNELLRKMSTRALEKASQFSWTSHVISLTKLIS